MSEAAKAARKANKAKALRLTSVSKDKVDASDFVAQPDINAGIKTGARPISKRAFKRGGKVEGVKAHAHAGRKARKSGGKAITADTLINRNVKEANEDREGIKHIGAFKKGGKVHRAHKKTGGKVNRRHYEDGGLTQKNKDFEELVKNMSDQIQSLKNQGKNVDEYYADQATKNIQKELMNPGSNQFKKGGKVHRAHKKTGGSDGITQWLKDHESDYDDRTGAGAITDDQGNDYDPNKDGDGKKRGGRATHHGKHHRHHKAGGGAMIDPRAAAAANIANSNRAGVPTGRLASVPTGSQALKLMGMKKGGKAAHPDIAEDKALIKKMVKGEALKHRKHGGEASHKWIQGAIKHPGALHKELHVAAGEKIPAKKLEKATHSSNPKLAKRANLAKTLKSLHKKDGGSATHKGLEMMEMTGVRRTGDRIPRKSGGKVGKGKTHINIMINPHGAGNGPTPAGMPQAGMPKPAGTPVPVAPPSAPPMGMPMGVPMGMPMGAPPAMPQQGAMPPMPRKRGGRAYPIKDGAGGGEGRLQKMKAYGTKPPKGPEAY